MVPDTAPLLESDPEPTEQAPLVDPDNRDKPDAGYRSAGWALADKAAGYEVTLKLRLLDVAAAVVLFVVVLLLHGRFSHSGDTPRTSEHTVAVAALQSTADLRTALPAGHHHHHEFGSYATEMSKDPQASKVKVVVTPAGEAAQATEMSKETKVVVTPAGEAAQAPAEPYACHDTWTWYGGHDGQEFTGSAALATSLPAAVSEFYGAPDSHRDKPSTYIAEGGDAQAQIYGEVTPAGMYAMLSHAICVATPPEPLNPADQSCQDGTDDATIKKIVPNYRFFDLGSGAGKFPVAAALMGFKSAKGIELDTTRSALSSTRLAAVLAKYPCLNGTLTTETGSFLTEVDWTKGTEPRLLFLDAVFFASFWPKVSDLMKHAEWGNGTVVMVLGRKFTEAESGLKEVSTAEIPASWTPHSTVRFYQRA